MNDSTLKELKVVVEGAVQPVRTTFARKRCMREELLAHLVSIVEEEARHGDEHAALERAGERFGDPLDLSRQLQASVSRRDRFRSVLERLGFQSGESIWHLAAKLFLATLLMYAIALFVAAPIVMVVGRRADCPTYLDKPWLPHFVSGMLLLVLYNAALSLFFALLLNKIGRILVSKRWGRISLAVLCGLLSPLALSGAFSAAAVLFLLMARQATELWRYQKAWA
jgi:hypothetical protein